MRIIPLMGLRHAILLLLLQHIVASYEHELQSFHRRAIHVEKSALLTFKRTLTSYPPSLLANWNDSNHVCDFYGVGCNKWRLHVVSLQLNRTLIGGPLSPSLANLTGLRELDLSDNSLTGEIPLEFSHLWRLTILELSGNQLSGPIPESLSLLKGLGYLHLSSNSFQGQIPSSIFHNCTQLGVVDLSDNALSGEIPSEVGIHLPFLLTLNIYLNNLSGKLPLWLCNSSFLIELDVDNNNFTGELPSEIVKKLGNLKILHLSYNAFSSHNNNTNLDPFFIALSNCSELVELEMEGIGLGGHLPRSIGGFTKQLSIVNLDDNVIFGPIPSDIANLTNLTLLNLSSNLLNGMIPDGISQFTMLQRLILSHNFLFGSIPSAFGNISSMGLLDLSSNRLHGEIPISLGNIGGINEMYLQKNQLSGLFPTSLGMCINLDKLDLSYNRLEGRIPQEIAGIVKIFLNLSNNKLQGPLPFELSKMDQVQEIDLSSNNLSGGIVPQLSTCIAVKLVNLSHNSLQGRVPESLGDLLNLESLDLSFNNLSGEIPLSFNKCTHLTELNLSYNNFTGSIPTGGVFSSFTILSFLGNPYLCGSLTDQACSVRRRRWTPSIKILIAMCVGASLSAFMLVICCVVSFRKIKKRIAEERGDDRVGISSLAMTSRYPRITYRELAEATRNFDEETMVGSGGYGRVYRGVLADGSVVAVKVLQLQSGNSTKSFNRECEVLKRIRHRNLIRIITACSLPEFKALVLPFMTNGSLESRLYSGSCDLNLVQRLNICSDVAEGMAYLHHHSPVKVIHCDLKPSNVLLNEEMTALVSDFGIAKLVMTVGLGNSTGGGESFTANMLCGSVGYIAPEYGLGCNASTKGDVYSFGVLVLEMMTRKRPTDELFQSGLSLHSWVRSHYHGREKVVDSLLVSSVKDQSPEVRRMWEVALGEMIELGLLCSQESPSGRPTMLHAADDLDRLKRYLSGDTTATFTSSLGMSSSSMGED